MAVPKIWRKIPEQYNLIGKKCIECNELFFPGRHVCKSCGCFELEDYKFKGNGKIVTFTIIRTKHHDSEHETVEIPSRNVPYSLAIIELEEGPRLTAEIVDSPFENIEIGVNVNLVFRKILEKGRKGVIQYGYKFRLV